MPRTLPRLATFALLALVAGFLVGCGSQTTLRTVWKSPDAMPKEPFDKVVTIVVNATPAERRAGEDEMANCVTRSHAIPSYTMVSDADLKDRAKVEAILKQHGIDGAIVLRLVSRENSTEYIPPTVMAQEGDIINYQGPQSLYQFSEGPIYGSGYTVTTTTIQAQISIFDVATDKLIWAGSSTSTDPASIDDMIVQVAKATVAELKKQGILPAK